MKGQEFKITKIHTDGHVWLEKVPEEELLPNPTEIFEREPTVVAVLFSRMYRRG